ncbi:hypothetical protein EDC04DRAFT_2893224 [Pisolithus marmoratus]|nr:hypothetical protein EDC04DRAFT_2893224 [Pisolithus marmoratus]
MSSFSAMPRDSSPSARHRTPHPPPRPLSPGVASKLFFSVRKPFTSSSSHISQRNKPSERPYGGMYSTPEERHPCTPSRVTRPHYIDASVERPSIEQIAMGLHISRTPHLRSGNPVQRHSPLSTPSLRRLVNAPGSAPLVLPHHSHPHVLHDSSSPAQQRQRHSLPPPPRRSSMKKTTASSSTPDPPQKTPTLLSSSPSISTVTSGGPLTPGSWSVRSLKLRMSKYIPGHRTSSTVASMDRASTFTSSGSDATRPTTPRKSVRFSTSVLALDKLPS